MDLSDPIEQQFVGPCSGRLRTGSPCVVAAGGDTPALGTSSAPDTSPDACSRTRMLRWHRVGLPREPGCGFFKDLPLDLQLLDLSAQSSNPPRAPRSSARRLSAPRPGPSASPSCGSSAPSARTPGSALPASAPLVPFQLFDAGTPARTVVSFLALWTPFSLKRSGVHSTGATPDRGSWTPSPKRLGVHRGGGQLHEGSWCITLEVEDSKRGAMGKLGLFAPPEEAGDGQVQ